MAQKNVRRKGGATATQLRIAKRIVNSKRHTTGYVIDGKNISVPDVTRLARKNRVHGVHVVGNHIQSMSGRRPLLSLPMIFGNGTRVV